LLKAPAESVQAKPVCAAQFRSEVLSQRLRGHFYSRSRCRQAILDEPILDQFGIAQPCLLVYLCTESLELSVC
jgi:hypothetical protein